MSIIQSIPADVVVEHARSRIKGYLDDAHATARRLRAGEIDWITAFNLISDMQSGVQTVCLTLEALLADYRRPARDQLGQVVELRTATQTELQALQTNLRENNLFDGPTGSSV
ncbi:MAG: hypothetical protein JSR28_15275 [Proteobacteria bacterium]|nr:hypothetical protein [Pseudomonadota bacterium]